MKKPLSFLIALLLLGGCSVKPKPLSFEERNQQVFQDMAAQFNRNAPPETPITIDDAMAHALLFNLGHRVKNMDRVIAMGMKNIASQKMLPQIAENAGYVNQSKLSSESGQLETTTSSLSISWNVLDLGISYISAKQQADRVLIARELERKAAHNLMKEVRATYWRAIAAERLEKAIVPLKIKLDKALASSRQAEKEQIEPPTEALSYQVTLLETLQKLQRLQKQVAGARTNLAELMGLDPGSSFTLVEHKAHEPINLAKLPKIETMEGYALRHRPELWEKDYTRRIRALETRKTLLRLFPGLDFSQSLEYDDTESYANNSWGEFGVNVTWNLLNLLQAPDNIALAKNREKIEDISRLALNMSILVQVHVALRNLIDTREEYDISAQLSAAKEQLYIHTKAEQEADAANELDVISRESERILFITQHDLAYAKLQNAAGAFLVSLGWDVLPSDLKDLRYEDLKALINENNSLVATGKIPGLIKKRSENKSKAKIINSKTATTQDPELDTPIWEIFSNLNPFKSKQKKSVPEKSSTPPQATEQKDTLKTVEEAKEPLLIDNEAKQPEAVEVVEPLEVVKPIEVEKPTEVAEKVEEILSVTDTKTSLAARKIEAAQVAKSIEEAKNSTSKKGSVIAKKIVDGDDYVGLSFIIDKNLRYKHFHLESPKRFVIDFYNAGIYGINNLKGFSNQLISTIKVGHPGKNTSRVVLKLNQDSSTESDLSSDETTSYLNFKLSEKTNKQPTTSHDSP
ncbi:MAG: TolC family protein [Magnetococcales bacterium]|nr:TolC family protein [Magnetococcales bacterium]